MSINFKKKKKARKEVQEIYDMATGESINRLINKEENYKYSPEKESWESGIIALGYEKAAAQNIVKAILNEQDETTRKIYFYKYRDDMTLEQIGEVVGLRKSAVHKRIKHLEEQVRQKMGRAEK